MKFHDEKTNELYWQMQKDYGRYIEIKDYFGPARKVVEDDLKKSENEFISHVESRLNREQEPCEWEKDNPHIQEMWYTPWKFCPMCGRELNPGLNLEGENG